MQEFHDILQTIDSMIGGGQWFAFFLLGTGVFFTLYLRFPQLRYFRHAISCVQGKFDRKGDEGDTTHFQALATALSGTVGTGNIAGVALAVYLGGPAALFWMLITAMLGMTTKFVEVTLSHKYREKAADGSIAGGPMYYMKNKLGMKWLAVLFAVATVFSSFGTGNLPQINSIANSVSATFGVSKVLTGLVLAVLLFMVIIGGIRRIAKVTEKLVPLMAILYFLGALLVIFYNYENVIPSLVSVFSDVFTGTAATGGFLGAGFAYAFNRGVNRGLFSNEAGQGSAPIAHAAARAHEPVSEGMVAILEPFIDTIIICMVTGLVLLSSGVWKEKHENTFQMADLAVLERTYDEGDPRDVEAIFRYLQGKETIGMYSGKLDVEHGKIVQDLSVLHARSIAEDVVVYRDGTPLSGSVSVDNGKIVDPEGSITLSGKSLLHSAPLTAVAFTKSVLGGYGQYIVSIGLLLFAFSTAISWSYYGDRAMTFLFGSRSVVYYRLLYVAGFFVASFTDTTIVWTFSGITIALMTLPNLVGILLLHKDMKKTVRTYWDGFREEFPDRRVPE
jgi:AGCS family alanine or glycine:cation symporter